MPGELHPRVQLPERFLDPWAAAQNRLVARDHVATHLLGSRHEGSGDVTAADVFAQRGLDLARQIGRELLS